MFLSIDGISRLLDCSRPFAEHVAKELPFVIVGKSKRYPKDAVLKFAAGQMVQHPQNKAEQDQQ